MPYIDIYTDDATPEEKHQALINFMEIEDSFEASNWQIFKLEDGTFRESCCEACGVSYYKNLEDWQKASCVYADQSQWVDDE